MEDNQGPQEPTVTKAAVSVVAGGIDTKKVNLWKIHKAVEKLGAYELVTGRRLWKNVYDELGGSPGSTSAATCTRRHYERLVLPYVRHLKGEEDKPLPPSKPRKQYKGSKGTEAGERSKRAKKKGQEQVPPDRVKLEVAAGTEDVGDTPERGRAAEGCSSAVVPSLSPSEGGPGPCRTHPQTSKRLFSSFSSHGNPPIMSPLAKKKLLAQVSKAESLPCHKRHCPEGRLAGSNTSPEPPRLATGPHLQELRSPEPAGAQDTAPSVGSEVGPGGPAPTVFTGCFHTYRSEVLTPAGCHPLWGYFSSLKDFLEPPSPFPARREEPEQPQDLRSKAGQPWRGENRGARAAAKACWVPPGPTAKPRAISPFLKEPDGRDTGASSPGSQQVLAKPKAVVASPGYAAPQAPDGYKGATLHFPASFGNPLEHLKTQGVPPAPSLSLNPFIVPAFPSPLVVTSDLCRPLATGPGHYRASYESSLRHRLYPGTTWHSQPACASPHAPAFHRHTKL
ncbi:AT-rich interactive domain-containing protein 5A isoform X2 [Nyctibius grandis]|uniref:AT-rich interactive domain-containing protein 5A isoform X2 n=1 Tax=Nyctibius grandis TaxID=48427 RepID=UPI0035BC35B3